MIRYCVECILPDSRPHLVMDEDGVCNACRNHSLRPLVDWTTRRKAFAKVAQSVKSLGRDYDCLVPVSGGKDSTWQTAVCLEYGLRPLAVTWRPPGRTQIGQRNLDNLIAMGVDHIDYTINPEIERRFMVKTFIEAGSTAIPMHLAIFSIPLKVAVALNVPLVVWGENSAQEYGGSAEDASAVALTSTWVQRYGVTQGTVAKDWVDSELTLRDLSAYMPPSDDTLFRSGCQAVFLGQYFAWDPELSRSVASANGFAANAAGPRTGSYDYADLDDDFISLHHWMKWYKFGFTRTNDNLSLEIRNGRTTRSEAIQVLRQMGDETPWADLERFSQFSGLPTSELLRIADGFRNESIWHRRPDGVWEIPGFLIQDWDWRASEAQGAFK